MAVPRRHKTRRSTWFLPAALAALVLTISSGLFVAPAARTVAAGPASTMANDANNRPLLDGWRDIAIVDRNNTATVGAVLTSFDYYARNTNPFNILVVNPANEVTWVSPSVVPPGTGTQTYTPVSPVAVLAGDAIGLYFPPILQPTIPYEFAGAEGLFTAMGLGTPTVSQTLIKYPAGNHARKYSIVGYLSCYATCYVDAVLGSDSNDGLSPASPLETIQEGVDRVMDGGEVIVATGTYVEQVQIGRPVTLTGPNAAVPGNGIRGPEATIDGTSISGDCVHAHYTTDVTVQGFRVQNCDYDGFNVHDSDNVSIKNNVVTLFADDGIDFDYSDVYGVNGGEISGNLVVNGGPSSERAIEVEYSNAVDITDNEVTGHEGEEPVSVDPSSNIQFLRNYIHDNPCTSCDAAVIFDDVTGLLVAENHIVTDPLSSSEDAIEFEDANSAVIVRNNILHAGSDSIRIYGSGNFDFQVFQNDLGTAGDQALQVNSGSYTGAMPAEHNWWGAADGPSGDGPGSGTDLDDFDGVTDVDPWLCLGTDTSAAIGFQPNLAAVSPCDATPPVWSYSYAKWGEGPGSYTPGTWSTKWVKLTFTCTDNPGGSGVAQARGDLNITYQDGIYTDPILGSEGTLKGDNEYEYCLDKAGNIATSIDPAGPVMVDTKAPVCKANPLTTRVKRNTTATPLEIFIDGTEATSGLDLGSSTISVVAAGGASYSGTPSFVGGSGSLKVHFDSVTMGSSYGGRLTLTVKVKDVAGNSATCATFTVRAQ
ncbi:MAG: right-handed parallel beta-helix repeat-containing protein [Dehalococcoidia bacterium]|nr:right-handed parallel beta-helix repeat-containing protein [Dehalococcoidia bacterium]MCB9486347.1 right-handed parallel beta-helix repeat-containing protein [Thermoflexaceae bacterium]